jgi:uncharacterized protein YaaW (UPF0174 family)
MITPSAPDHAPDDHLPCLPLLDADEDLLSVLREAPNEMLDPLVGYITSNGEGRLASSLTRCPAYVRHQPNHRAYWQEIASEVQTFGANSMVSVLRGGRGVRYREIVEDVASKFGVKPIPSNDVGAIERDILLAVLSRAYDKMTSEQRLEFLSALGLEYGQVPKALPFIAVQSAFKIGGFAVYRASVIIANAVAKAILGRGLTVASNTALTRLLGLFAGPFGWAVTGLWTAFDVASPAYRVTIPCVIQIATIRQGMAGGDQTSATAT